LPGRKNAGSLTDKVASCCGRASVKSIECWGRWIGDTENEVRNPGDSDKRRHGKSGCGSERRTGDVARVMDEWRAKGSPQKCKKAVKSHTNTQAGHKTRRDPVHSFAHSKNLAFLNRERTAACKKAVRGITGVIIVRVSETGITSGRSAFRTIQVKVIPASECRTVTRVAINRVLSAI
jgi:hypothetical protein